MDHFDALVAGLVLTLASFMLALWGARIVGRSNVMLSGLSIVYVVVLSATLALLTRGLLSFIGEPLSAFAVAAGFYAIATMVVMRMLKRKPALTDMADPSHDL